VVRPDALLDRLRQTGDPLVRQQLERFDRGPLHDLPAGSFEAKVAGECVAEIDRLVWSGATGEAARRYRAYTGRPSLEAAETIRAWPLLARQGKLRRLGWSDEGEDTSDP
jgi:methionyl-tRNA formyltransferase